MAAALIAPAPASAQFVRWWEPVSVSSEGAMRPDLAVGGDGAAVAVWERHYGDKSIAQAALRRPEGPFSLPVNLSVPVDDAARGAGGVAFGLSDVRVAMSRGGDAMAVWTRTRGDLSVVQAAARAAGGDFGKPVDVSAPGAGTHSPRVALDAAGNALVTWAQNDGERFVVQAATRPANGDFTAPVEVSAEGPGQVLEPELAMNARGDAVIVWARYFGDHKVVQAAARGAGQPFGPQEDLSRGGYAFGSDAHVAIGPDGDAVAIWTQLDDFDDPAASAQSALRPAGGSFGAATDLSAPNQAAALPDVEAGPAGETIAIWTEGGATDRAVRAAIRPAGGQFARPVELGRDVRPLDASVAIGRSGTAMAVWVAQGGGREVRVALRPANGDFRRLQSPADVREASGAPQVGLDDSGQAIAVFERGSTSTVVQAAAYAAEEPPALPAVAALRLTPERVRARAGTSVTYSISRPGTVRFEVAREVRGKLVAVPGSLSRNRSAGRDRFKFTGRIGGRVLKPGRYRLLATPTSGPDTGRTVSRTFTVVR